jgi:hypothetical protein
MGSWPQQVAAIRLPLTGAQELVEHIALIAQAVTLLHRTSWERRVAVGHGRLQSVVSYNDAS